MTPEQEKKWREGTTEVEKEMCIFIEKEFGRDAWNPCRGGYTVKEIEATYLAARKKAQEEIDKINHERLKFKDQVIDTCKRAENAEEELVKAKDKNTYFCGDLSGVCYNCGARHPEENSCVAFWINEHDKKIDEVIKRDRLLDKCLPWIMNFALAEGDMEKLNGGVNSYGHTYRQWLTDYKALLGGK